MRSYLTVTEPQAREESELPTRMSIDNSESCCKRWEKERKRRFSKEFYSIFPRDGGQQAVYYTKPFRIRINI